MGRHTHIRRTIFVVRVFQNHFSCLDYALVCTAVWSCRLGMATLESLLHMKEDEDGSLL